MSGNFPGPGHWELVQGRQIRYLVPLRGTKCASPD